MYVSQTSKEGVFISNCSDEVYANLARLLAFCCLVQKQRTATGSDFISHVDIVAVCAMLSVSPAREVGIRFNHLRKPSCCCVTLKHTSAQGGTRNPDPVFRAHVANSPLLKREHFNFELFSHDASWHHQVELERLSLCGELCVDGSCVYEKDSSLRCDQIDPMVSIYSSLSSGLAVSCVCNSAAFDNYADLVVSMCDMCSSYWADNEDWNWSLGLLRAMTSCHAVPNRCKSAQGECGDGKGIASTVNESPLTSFHRHHIPPVAKVQR